MKKLSLEQEEQFKKVLFKKCLSRYNRNLQLLPKVEVCKPGYALGSVETIVEKQLIGWKGSGGMGNLSKHPPKGRKPG